MSGLGDVDVDVDHLDVVGAGGLLETAVEVVGALGGRARFVSTLTDAGAPELVTRAEVLCASASLWDVGASRNALRRSAALAHGHDTSVALSIFGSPDAPPRGAGLLELVTLDVDILFSDEEALVALFGAPSRGRALDAAEETGILVACQRGDLGSIVLGGRGRIVVAPDPAPSPAHAAGVQGWYVAGFLYGLTHGSRPEECARLGAMCLGQAAPGARPGAELGALARERGLL